MEIKKTIHSRRRNRPNGRRNNFSRNSFQSNAGNRPKGSAPKVLEKYLGLAQDALSNGDRIKAEGFFQHAEHYQRLINTLNENGNAKKINNGENPKEEKEHANNSDQKPLSRTERAISGKNERLNNKSQEAEKSSLEEQNEKEKFTPDGVEALKAFSGSLADKNSID